jgi:hypothetical protein
MPGLRAWSLNKRRFCCDILVSCPVVVLIYETYSRTVFGQHCRQLYFQYCTSLHILGQMLKHNVCVVSMFILFLHPRHHHSCFIESHSYIKRILAGAVACTIPPPASNAAAIVAVLVSVSPEEFTPVVRARFAEVLAELVNGSAAAISIEAVVDAAVGSRRMALNASRASLVTARLPLFSSGCASASSTLVPSAISERLIAASIPVAAPPTVRFTGCTAPSESRIETPAVQAPLPPELKKQATAATAVVAVVVTSVVAGTVTAAAAGAIGVSISSSAAGAASTGAAGAASPGASIYQLISAVQFMNVYGSMIGGGKRSIGSGRRSDGSGDENNITISEAANATDGSAAAFRRRVLATLPAFALLLGFFLVYLSSPPPPP